MSTQYRILIMAYLEDTTEQAELADEEVLARSISEPHLFGMLVDRYQEAFLRKARRVLGDRPEVHDAVQETFTKIYLYGSRFKTQEGATFSSWGYKILINTTLTYYQKLKRRGEISVNVDEEILVLAADKSDTHEKHVAKDMVASVLTRMPEPLAKILSLHFIEDLSQQEIADREGLSVAAVKTRVHRAKKIFKQISDGYNLLTI